MLVQYYQKVKDFAIANKKDVFLACTIVLVSIISFGLGRISVLLSQKEPIQIIQNSELQMTNNRNEVSTSTPKRETTYSSFNIQNSALGKYVASKNGSYYHFPWCSGAQKIKDENKVWFQTKEEAESRGFKPASNCPGL